MNILCLADLHIPFQQRDYWKSYWSHPMGNSNTFDDLLARTKADVICIAGDVLESPWHDPIAGGINLYDAISAICPSLPIVTCLGNHEFAYSSIDDTLDAYRRSRKTKTTDNVHVLDIEGRVTIGDCNFVGNVLWYDNTLMPAIPGCKPDLIYHGWLDSTIAGLVPSVECFVCKKQIESNILPDKKNVLVTHCVPHIKLNTFSTEDPDGRPNQYSGCRDYLQQLKGKIAAAVCGHTHRPEKHKIYGIKCVNVGNDYWFHIDNVLKYELLKI